MEDYKEKLRLAKEALDSGSYDKETIEYIFPELKESEDERIRKMLVEQMERWHKCALENNVVQDIKDSAYAIAWLEKQGEQKTTDKVEPKFVIGDKVIIHCNSNRGNIMPIYDGKIGKIENIFDLKRNPRGNICVRLDNGCNNAFFVEELEKVKEKNKQGEQKSA